MIIISRVSSVVEAMVATPFLINLNRYYPNISDWYHYQVVSKLNDPNCVLLHAYENNILVGVAIGKKGVDMKLRCVRVSRDYESSGLGLRLINAMLAELEERHPLVTVSQELLHDYSRMFQHYYGFKLTEVKKGIYRPAKLEYVYNGLLT